MAARRQYSILTLFLIFVLCVNLLNVQTVHADGEAPTEPAAPTQVETEPPTEPPVESTPEPVDSTPIPEESTPEPVETEVTTTSIADLLTQVPDNTEIVILDESGDPIPLATEEAAEVVEMFDPMWCPAGVLPGGSGCTINFNSIDDLINNMVSSTSTYDQHGVIYFVATTGLQTTGDSFTLTSSVASLGSGDFNTLNDFNLTLQGGWNGQNGSLATFTGQTNFGDQSITIGSTGSSNLWIGNITLSNFSFNSANNNAITMYTSTGDITLSNIDVNQQEGESYTAFLSSTSGDITVQNGSTFDGDNTNNAESRGFSATTGTGGTITISDTTFGQSSQNGGSYDGATLSAPIVTLTNVTSSNNDGDGITINNASVITLNNVNASNNGSNNSGSGVFINGPAGTNVFVNGGTFNNNRDYGIGVGNPNNVTIYVLSTPTCNGNDNGCSNDTLISDTTAPVITPTVTGTQGANNWYTSNVSVTWSVTDAQTGIKTSTGCSASNLSTETAGVALTCSATNNANLSNSVTVTIKIDKTAPSLNLPSDITSEATSSAGASITYTASATDNLDNNAIVSCAPASGSTFGIGTTKVDCSSTDAANNAANGSFLVQVGDTTGPIIAVHADVTEQATGPNGATVNYTTPTATDAVDGLIENVSCAPASGETFQLGDTTVTCEAKDARNNTSTSSFVVHVVDTMAPVIAFQPDITEEATGPDGALIAYTTPTASDIVDGPVAVTCLPASGETFPVGDTTVTCEATDQHENTSTSSFVAHVVDTTAPVIASHPDVTAEATSPAGAVVTYTEPIANDIVDLSVTVTCSPASGTTFAIGNTTVTCNAMDSHENLATPVTFTVHVVDTTAPGLNLPATITAYATGPQGVIVTFSASATDIVDSSVPVLCSHQSGAVFPVGMHTVNCSATDERGNRSEGSFIINVLDPNAPILSLPADIIAEATGPSGATVSFSVSATDVVDGPVPVTCSKNSGSTFGFGDTIVTCSATDNGGNTNTAAFLVTVQDTTAPTIISHADVAASTENSAGTVVNYASPATLDAVDGAGVASCSPASNSLFPVGNTTVTCSATDAHGNQASITFIVHVSLDGASSSVEQEQPASASFLIPFTGGELIDLDCNTVIWAFGIKLSFMNLCDYQSTVNPVSASDLPTELPNGSSFVMGLNVDILKDGNLVEELPAGSGIELDFPTYNQLLDQFAVLFWNDADGDGKGEWIEISEEIDLEKISDTLTASTGDELYQVAAGSDSLLTDLFYQILTTQKTGVFILVQK